MSQFSKRRILIVEDEEDIAASMKFSMEKDASYDVTVTRSGESGLSLARQRRFDLVLLDVMLPGMDGLEVCRELRGNPSTADIPILMLTARVDETDKLVGLELGADDYITKPFSMKELLARIKAHLRRASRSQDASGGEEFASDGLKIDFARHRAWAEGSEVELTRMEFALLAALVKGRGRVLTRDHLLELVWGYEYFGGSRTVDVHVRRLRKKLGASGDLIETVFGVGYRFRETPRDEEAE